MSGTGHLFCFGGENDAPFKGNRAAAAPRCGTARGTGAAVLSKSEDFAMQRFGWGRSGDAQAIKSEHPDRTVLTACSMVSSRLPTTASRAGGVSGSSATHEALSLSAAWAVASWGVRS
jgi:hypothetical protein